MSEDRDPQRQELDLRSFGRKRGRTPSPRQQRLLEEVLPRWQLDLGRLGKPLAGLFDCPIRDIWLEIGFGGGEHLVHMARSHPDVGFIGCEPFQDGVVKALSAIDEFGLRNIRIHPDDVRPMLRLLPSASIARVFILFPDPWPKARHAKRRLVAGSLLDQLARVMVSGSELRIATDIPAYARTAVLSAARHPGFRWRAQSAADWRSPWCDWPGTRYEAKALSAGRKPIYLTYSRR